MTPDPHLTTLRRLLEDLLADGTFNHRPITAGRVRDALEATAGHDNQAAEPSPLGELR